MKVGVGMSTGTFLIGALVCTTSLHRTERLGLGLRTFTLVFPRVFHRGEAGREVVWSSV